MTHHPLDDAADRRGAKRHTARRPDEGLISKARFVIAPPRHPAPEIAHPLSNSAARREHNVCKRGTRVSSEEALQQKGFCIHASQRVSSDDEAPHARPSLGAQQCNETLREADRQLLDGMVGALVNEGVFVLEGSLERPVGRYYAGIRDDVCQKRCAFEDKIQHPVPVGKSCSHCAKSGRHATDRVLYDVAHLKLDRAISTLERPEVARALGVVNPRAQIASHHMLNELCTRF
eukprot:CAMPEP_0177299756 /NCGR_PEP_ID=MMETSP0368-20130122/4196_1 /TAXON_ID=447022 ORGANISM="Scrippsiella hangoei-like, Strain SHHI-4" /NCGR_SAMPLE_ID=MMETSP0368 /ASSEMBLY_ACC=CAM_ASM_000363 /LENGTH=232 /DNA_ID=CAMNT_0018758111 /DNA_START=447 /DNA_END=1146 /DNA_ORIENTATION=-